MMDWFENTSDVAVNTFGAILALVPWLPEAIERHPIEAMGFIAVNAVVLIAARYMLR